MKLLKKNGIQMIKKVINKLTQIATLLTLFLIAYYVFTYDNKDYGELQSSGDGVYENMR